MIALFALRFAVKSIKRNPKKSLGTLLAVALGVTLLIGVQVGTLGIKQALGNEWYSTAGQSDLGVYDPSNPVFPGNLSDYLQANAGLTNLDIISQKFDLPLTFYYKGALTKNVLSQGVVLKDVNALGGFYDTSGRLLDTALLETNYTIFVNEPLAQQLGVGVGDVISTSMPDGAGGSVPLQLEVAAIVEPTMGRAAVDFLRNSPQAFTNIDTFQLSLVQPLRHYVTGLDIKFTGVDRSVSALNIDGGTFPGKEIVEANLKKIEVSLKQAASDFPYYSETLRVYSSRIQIAENINENIQGITSILTLFVFMLNLVGLLLIVNVQSMALDDQRYQTAVLRAMGSNKSQIFRVFLSESAIVGILGSLVGVGFGMFYGKFIENTIIDIFGLSQHSTSFNFAPSLIITAMIFGVLLSVLTAVIPAWFAASRAITNELRGIQEEKIEGRRSRKPFVLGLSTLLAGLYAAQDAGKFWTDAAWTTFESSNTILISLGFSIFGLGILISYINKRVGYNIAAISIYSLSLYALFDRLDLVQEGNGNNWLLVNMLYLVLGSVMVVVVNFDVIMNALHKVLSVNPNLRAISQVSTRGMIAKKGRLTMVFTVLTLVLVLNLFLAVTSESIIGGNVNGYAVRSDGVDIVINSDVPNAQIKQVVESIDGVQQVFAFRSFNGPLFRADPAYYSAENVTSFLRFRTIVEYNQSEVNPSGIWGGTSFLPHALSVNDVTVNNHTYQYQLGLNQEESVDLSKQFFNQFWQNPTINYTAQLKAPDTWDVTGTEQRSGAMVIGDFFANDIQDVYFQDANGSTIPAYNVGSVFSMLGAFSMLSGAFLVTPQLFAQLPQSKLVKEPNVFLVRSTNGYNDKEANQALALKIERKLNDLNNPDSLSSQLGILLGATTRIVQQEVYNFWATESSFWNFLNIFAALGLIIGAAGMIIIAIRSVQERTREIGMMRAIGFKRSSVVFTVAIELIFVSIVGLIAGSVSALFMTTAFVETMLGVSVSFPWATLGLYAFGVTGLAILAGILPGIRAAGVPASEALRYSG